MKFLLLKTLLLHKKKDEGFTLPIVIAIGMVMVLLSAVNLVRSGEENLNAISQRGSADALAMAELGVSRYRDFLLNNRVLALSNSDNWADTINIGDATNLTRLCTETDEISNWSNTATWRPINVAGNPVGSYRLIQYEYDRDGISGDADNNGILDDTEGGNVSDNYIFSQFSDNQDTDNDPSTPPEPFDPVINNHNDINNDGMSNAFGILTVQGQDNTGSIAQIQVQIPIGVNNRELNNLNPALWIQQDSDSISETNIGNVNMDSDGDGIDDEPEDGSIVFYQPGDSSSDGCDNPVDVAGINTISDPRPLPLLITATDLGGLNVRSIAGDISTDTYTGSIPNLSGTLTTYPVNYFESSSVVPVRARNRIVLGTIFDRVNGGADDPTNSDRASNSINTINGSEDFYYYTTGTDDLDLDDGEAIITDGTSKVILHIGGDLNIDAGAGGVRLVNSRHRSETGRTTIAGIAQYLEIHVEGNVVISGTGTVDITGLLRVGGQIEITGNPTVNVTGSIWTNNWDSNSGTVNIDTDQTTTASGEIVSEYNFFKDILERTPAPITFRPTEWETQEATP